MSGMPHHNIKLSYIYFKKVKVFFASLILVLNPMCEKHSN